MSAAWGTATKISTKTSWFGVIQGRCGPIQELYLAQRKEEAAAAVPDEWVNSKSLVGPPARIKQRYSAWEESGLTGLTVRSKQPEAIEVMAEAAGLNRR